MPKIVTPLQHRDTEFEAKVAEANYSSTAMNAASSCAHADTMATSKNPSIRTRRTTSFEELFRLAKQVRLSSLLSFS